MGMPDRWIRNPRPDPAVLDLIEQLRDAASKGLIRTIGVVTVDPMLNVETNQAGEDDPVRKRMLAAGLIELSQKILSSKE